MNAISNLGFEVFRNGQFHWNSSNTPDMYINQDGSIHCWTSSPFKNNTSNHGDLIDFLQVVNHNQTFKEAKDEAERLTGLTLPSIDTYKDNGYIIDNTNRKTGYIDEEFIKVFDVARRDNFERYKELLNEALPSLDFAKQKDIAQKYQIGYIEQSDRLSMPIRDENNRVVTLWKYNKNPKSYVNDKGVEITPSKVLFTKGKERSPFNIHNLQEYKKDINEEVFLCGGEKDTLNMLGNGFRAVTLGSENENLKDRYKPLFQDLKIVIAYDNDKAGVDGANKIAKQLQGVAKEIKTWDWQEIENKQELNLSKGYDMTDYLVDIKKHNLEFYKTNYQQNIKNEEIEMKNIPNTKEKQGFLKGIFNKMSLSDYQKVVANNISLKNRDKLNLEALDKYLSDGGNPNVKIGKDNTPLLHNLDNIEQIAKLLEYGADINIKNQYGKTLAQTLAENKHSQLLHDLQNYISQNQNNSFEKLKDKTKLKGFLQKVINNQVRLTLSEKQAQTYMDFLKSIKNKDTEEKTEFKLNPDFFKQVNDIKNSTFEEKAEFTTQKIDNLKDESQNIETKINDYKTTNKVDKSQLFKNLEKEIHEFSAMVEALKNENRELKRELELLIQKDEKENEKKSLEKENSSLKEKIEKMRDKKPEKTQEKSPERINKVSYQKTQEKEM